MRNAILLVVFWGAAACSVKADFTGTLYHCGPDDSCPTDYVCQATYCVPTAPGVDAGVDAGPITCGGGELSLGLEHSCTLEVDGSTWCWGRNDYGQVGDGTLVDQTRPVHVQGLPPVTQLSAGALHTCAIAAADGAVWCWGHNNVGQLGDGTTMDHRMPQAIAGTAGALAVTAGDQHTCALLSDHSVSCWGYNGQGQLGDNSTLDHSTPAKVMMIANAISLDAGGNNTCAVVGDGKTLCWGENDYYAVGNGDETGANVLVPSAVVSLSGAVSVSVGSTFACAVTTDGKVSCWGGNDYGNLGNGTFNYTSSPGVVAVPAKVVKIFTGGNHTCALDDQRRLWCWGNDQDNELGDGNYGDYTSPVLAFTNVEAAGLGGFATCIQRGGALECAGDNRRGELGFGQELAALVPTVSPMLHGLTKLAAGGGFACGIASDGTVQCWGSNGNGQLGDATLMSHSLPAPVFGLTNATSLAAGIIHMCALVSGGGISCWGYGGYGELGDGTFSQGRPIAEPVVGLGGPATQVAAGYYQTCAIVGGLVRCWGRGQQNALGNNSTVSQPMPITVPNISNAIQVAVGDLHGCALKQDGTVWCWGFNAYGQLGQGNVMVFPMALQVPGLSGVAELGSFADYTCARKSDGSVVCWGQGSQGRLGNGMNANQPSPVPVLNVSTATRLFTGPDHACALRTDATLACWGAGSSGQIGDNTVFDHQAAAQINAANITSATSGSGFTCATRTGGDVLCWGDDHQGQLGDGVDLDSRIVRPVSLTCP